MASEDDPFDLDGDSDRTIMIPAPGGRRAPAPSTSESPRTRIPPVTKLPIRKLGGINPLVAVANPLLNLVAPLRNTLSHPDPDALSQQLTQAVRQFEEDARAARIDSEVIRDARYVLCTFIDETIAATPWGGGGVWSKQSLLVAFHRDVKGGEQFFQMLRQFAQEPHRYINLLELMYVCLTLGFAGRYARVEGGRAQLDELRERLFRMLEEERGKPDKELSPHWQGVTELRNPLVRLVPLWVVGAIGSLLLFGIYVGFSYRLSDLSDPVREKIAAIKFEDAPLPVALPPTTRLRPFLQTEIQRNLVALREDRDKSIVTLVGTNLFQPGTAFLGSDYIPVVAKIAEALRSQQGRVVVVGHTDNVPIRTPQFHSNYDLSISRAQSVMRMLADKAGDASRFSADGRGKEEPLVANNTPGNRARNRRVEITLYAGSK
jgi:type VI secretion system protein ImpK